MTDHVVSGDGTFIAFDKRGHGPAVILLGGILSDRSDVAALADALSAQFTVYSVDRRGRGQSGTGRRYDVALEVADIAAVIALAGVPVGLFGHSSGAALALFCAINCKDVAALVLYEPPFEVADIDDSIPSYVLEVEAHIAAGRGGEAIKAFLCAAGVPDGVATAMSADPRRQMAAPSMLNDFELLSVRRGSRIPEADASQIAAPTLILAGENSPSFFWDVAKRLGQLIPAAEVKIISNADHAAEASLVGPVVAEFFSPMLTDQTGSRETSSFLAAET